jgi:Family of unknown function (DUF6131)
LDTRGGISAGPRVVDPPTARNLWTHVSVGPGNNITTKSPVSPETALLSASDEAGRRKSRGGNVIILGLILLVLGYVLGIQLLYYVGGILLVVGVVLVVLGSTGRAVGGRRHYF